MPITQQLKPDPIVTANVEVRFTSSLEDKDFWGVVFESLKPILPDIHVLGQTVPKHVREVQGSPLMFTPEISFQNEQYSVAVGERVMLFEILTEYPSWKEYFPFIKEILSKATVWQIEKIHRCGVRYSSIFPQYQKMSEALASSFRLEFEGYSRVNDFFRTVFVKDDIQLFFQIGENIQVHQRGRGDKQGLYLDIDASQAVNLPGSLNDQFFWIIDQLHKAEKDLFEQVIKQEELAKLLNQS